MIQNDIAKMKGKSSNTEIIKKKPIETWTQKSYKPYKPHRNRTLEGVS